MFKMLAKFILAFGIVGYLVYQGQLDFTLIYKVLDYPMLLLTALFCYAGIIFITTFRWRWLLELEITPSLPYWQVNKLTWIGVFFSTILPGGVSGDLVKVFYARELNKEVSNSFLLTTVFIDRFLGMLGLLLLQGIAALLFHQELMKLSPTIENVLIFNLFLTLVGVLIVISLMIPASWRSPLTTAADHLPWVGKKVVKILSALWLIGDNKRVVLKIIALSICTQMVATFIFWLITSPFYPFPLSFKHALCFIPLGMVLVAIPISPMGIGVGHAAFNQLFAHFNINNGASLFNLYLLVMLMVNLSGSIPFILNRRKINNSSVKIAA